MDKAECRTATKAMAIMLRLTRTSTRVKPEEEGRGRREEGGHGAEGKGLRAKGRGQKEEDREQNTEDRGRRAEDGGQRIWRKDGLYAVHIKIPILEKIFQSRSAGLKYFYGSSSTLRSGEKACKMTMVRWSLSCR